MELTRREASWALEAGNGSKKSPIRDCSKPMTLEECRSRALANNLDLYAARLAELSKKRLRSAALLEIAPSLTFTGNYDTQDNEEYAYSDLLGYEGEPPETGPGDGVTHYSLSRERHRWRHLLEIRWSPIDAALAYYLARSANNDRLNKHYHKVRLAQKIVETVESSFFRILSLRRRLPAARELVKVRKGIAEASADLFAQKLMGIEERTQAKMELLKAEACLARTRSDLERHQSRLMTAMGLGSNNCQKALNLAGDLTSPIYKPGLCDVEKSAIMNRPEAYQAGIARLKSLDHRQSLRLEQFPRVAIFWRSAGDSNKFLYNNNWKEFGITAQFDLVKWLSTRQKSASAAIDSERTRAELAAVALSLASDARIAALDYLWTMERLERVEQSWKTCVKVYDAARERALGGAMAEISLKKIYADMIFERMELDRLLGEAHACLARTRSAMGVNYQAPLPWD
jgi:outer membrane protein TolC